MSRLAFLAGLLLGALGGVCIGLLLPTVEEQPLTFHPDWTGTPAYDWKGTVSSTTYGG